MTLLHRPLVLLAGLWLLPVPTATAQLSGSRGGVTPGDRNSLASGGLQELSPEVVQGYVAIDGLAELRVKPTEIRIVLAVTAEGKTPSECHQQVSGKVNDLTRAWKDVGIDQTKIVEDFIAVLPRYEFEIENVRGQETAVEKKAGYLMQSNLHVAVKDDAEAMRAVRLAFQNDVADVIAFDYWSDDLDRMKIEARSAAVKAAREKADALLGALFDQRPPIINVQEQTRVHYPQSLYESFDNSHAAEYQTSFSRRDLPQIRTFRPKNTYYRGLDLDADVQPKELPMRAEISITSTVRLYFQSPAANREPAPKPNAK